MSQHEQGGNVQGQSSLEAIANPVQSFDHIKFVISGFELLTQPFDVAVDGAVVDIDLVIIASRRSRIPGQIRCGVQERA
jgi:hypothetical protein